MTGPKLATPPDPAWFLLGSSAVGRDSHAGEEPLQGEAALFEAFGVLDADVAVVPGLPPVAALGPAWGGGENEPVFGRVVLQPQRCARVPEATFHLVRCTRVREVYGGAELVLAVPRRGAHRIGPRPVDALKPTVGKPLVIIRAEG